MDLDSMMGLGEVVYIDQDGYVIENLRGVAAPEVYLECDGDGTVFAWAETYAQARAWEQGWYLIPGYSEEFSDSSFTMHPAEWVHGALAEKILSVPGYYSLVLVTDDSGEAGWSDEKKHILGWCVAYRKTIV